MQIGQNPKEEFEKVGFPVFAILWKNFLGGSGRGHSKVIQLHSGNLGIQGFWMCDIWCGSYKQKRIGLGYSAPCRRIYVFFCVWDFCRSLHQPSKLHCPPLHGLVCSTTFSRRKIKTKILTITIGLLALLVLGAFSNIHLSAFQRLHTFSFMFSWRNSAFLRCFNPLTFQLHCLNMHTLFHPSGSKAPNYEWLPQRKVLHEQALTAACPDERGLQGAFHRCLQLQFFIKTFFAQVFTCALCWPTTLMVTHQCIWWHVQRSQPSLRFSTLLRMHCSNFMG